MSRTDPETAVEELPNLGKVSGQWLREIGIRNRRELEEIGAVEAFCRIKLVTGGVSRNLLWALAGALLDLPWDELPTELKERLEAELQRHEEEDP